MKNFLFIHGGPGSNCFAEQELFAPYLRDQNCEFYYWNEPSRYRPNLPGGEVYSSEKAFEKWVQSAQDMLSDLAKQKGPIHLVAHSFAAIAAVRIVRAELDSVASLTFAGPSFFLNEGYRKVLELAAQDFDSLLPIQSQKIRKLASASTQFFDGAMEEALKLALEDANLFSHYFYDPVKLQNYFSVWQKRRVQYDVESFFDVLRDISRRDSKEPRLDHSTSSFNWLPLGDFKTPLSVPVQCFFGKQDPVVLRSLEIELLTRLFKDLTIHELDECGHFPHVEQAGFFFRQILNRDHRYRKNEDTARNHLHIF